MVESLAAELADVGELLASQERAGLGRDDVLESMFRSWCSRLSSSGTKFNPKQKTALTDAISKGPWSSSQRQELARFVLLNGQKLKASAANRRSNQKLLHIENMTPVDIMVKLKNTAKYSRTSRCSILASLGNLLGLQCPDNPTLYRMTALIAYCEGEYNMSQNEVNDTMNTLQTFLKSQPAQEGVEYIDNYPPTAELLPKVIKQKAFGGEDNIPPEQQIPELSTILAGNKMRGGRSLTAGKKQPSWMQHVPEEYRKSVAATISASSTPASSKNSDKEQSLANCHEPNPIPTAEVFRFRVASEPHPQESPKADKSSDQSARDPGMCGSCGQPLGDHDHDHGAQTLENDVGEPDLDQHEAELLKVLAARKKPGKKPAGRTKPKNTVAGNLVLGCSKCVWSKGGCAQCRNPAFGGARGCKPPMKAMKAMKVMKAMKIMKSAMKKRKGGN